MPNITIVTDAWEGQINGVVTTLKKTIKGLEQRGYRVTVISPELFSTIPMPFYKEIQWSCDIWNVGKEIEKSQPDYLHISTEGPLGFAAKRWAKKRKYRYTTSYHTRFPEYIESRFNIPVSLTYRYMKWFHKDSDGVMVNTESMRQVLASHGLLNTVPWGRGVDSQIFTMEGPLDSTMIKYPGPYWLNVGRVSVEKNLEAFYSLDLPGTKFQVGEGPAMASLQARFPKIVFLGTHTGESLAAKYRTANAFVFPSKSDTFGLVMLESLASGVPVAAYPVPGPQDIIEHDHTGYLNDDLQIACQNVMDMNRHYCRRWAETQSWDNSVEQFISNIKSKD